MTFQPAEKVMGLDVWVCTYSVAGIQYGIKLPASDPRQLERDHAGVGDYGLRVDGRLVGHIE